MRRSPRSFKRLSRAKLAKFKIGKDEQIDYKNLQFLQRYITDRGKIVARRVSGITSKQQRKLSSAIKHARYLGLLSVGGVHKL